MTKIKPVPKYIFAKFIFIHFHICFLSICLRMANSCPKPAFVVVDPYRAAENAYPKSVRLTADRRSSLYYSKILQPHAHSHRKSGAEKTHCGSSIKIFKLNMENVSFRNKYIGNKQQRRSQHTNSCYDDDDDDMCVCRQKNGHKSKAILAYLLLFFSYTFCFRVTTMYIHFLKKNFHEYILLTFISRYYY